MVSITSTANFATNFSPKTKQVKGHDVQPFQVKNFNNTLAKVNAQNILAYNNMLAFTGKEKMNVEFLNINKMDMVNEYAKDMDAIISDVKERTATDKTREGQFLNWIGELPKNQLENIDKIYDLVNEANKNGKFNKVAIIGIGGSRHTTETMAQLLNMEDKICFYSGCDNKSFDKFTANLDLDKTLFLVVSKSGGTVETMTGYDKTKALLEEKFGVEGAKKHFVAFTDQSDKSKLRQKVNAGEINLSGLVHDDVGGRFSIFDDATLFALAHSGMKKEDMKELMEGVLQAQDKFLNHNLMENKAAQQAIFNVKAVESGKTKHYVEYFGDMFEGAKLWETQLKNESLKANVSTNAFVGPGYLHYNAESDLDSANKDSFYTFVSVKDDEDKTAKAILTGVKNAYSSLHPVSAIELPDLSPKSIGEFIELKHFETLYTGALLRRDGEKQEVMQEVLQPNVEIYKKEVRAAMAAQ